MFYSLFEFEKEHVLNLFPSSREMNWLFYEAMEEDYEMAYGNVSVPSRGELGVLLKEQSMTSLLI